MDNKNTREEKLSILFATHPKTDKFYLASDDRAFFDQHNADGYAQGLADRKVTEYSRNVVEHFQQGIKEPIAVTETIDKTADETEETTSEENAAPAAPGDGQAEEGGDEAGKDESGSPESGEDRAAVVAKYEEVFGKKPSNFMKVETMQAKIAEALAK